MKPLTARTTQLHGGIDPEVNYSPALADGTPGATQWESGVDPITTFLEDEDVPVADVSEWMPENRPKPTSSRAWSISLSRSGRR